MHQIDSWSFPSGYAVLMDFMISELRIRFKNKLLLPNTEEDSRPPL